MQWDNEFSNIQYKVLNLKKKNMLHFNKKKRFICFTMTLPRNHQREAYTHVIRLTCLFEIYKEHDLHYLKCVFFFYNDVAMIPAARSKHTRHIFNIFIWNLRKKTCHALLIICFTQWWQREANIHVTFSEYLRMFTVINRHTCHM